MYLTPWVHNAAYPDTSSLARLVAHPRFRGLKDEDLALALWRYTLDPVAGFYHFWSPSDREFERPYVPSDYVKDPLKLINSYGYMLCGTVAAVYANLCEAAGLEARQVGLTGHCLNEVRYGGSWHLIDCDLRAVHRVRDGSRRIASLRELLRDPELVAHPVERSEPVYYLPDRTPEKMAQEVYAPGVGNEMPRFLQAFHTMDYVLRPGETLTRHAGPVGGRWHFPPHWISGAAKYGEEWLSAGPRERFPPHRTYCNGVFEYRPDLTSASRDAELGAWERKNLIATPQGLAVGDPAGGRGWCVFLLHSPWVFAGRPGDPLDASPAKKSEAVLVDVEVTVPPNAKGSVALRFSLDGESWSEVRRLDQSGTLHADLTEPLDRRHRGLLGLEVRGEAVVRSFATRAWFQHAPNSFPHLTPGGTVFHYHGGDERGGRTLTEPWSEALDGDERAWARTLVSASHFKRGTKPGERFSPAEPGRSWQAVFRLAPAAFRPRPVVRAWCWASIATFKGDPEAPPPEYRSRPPHAKLEAALAADGPWTPVAESAIPLHKDGWNFALDGAFSVPGPGAAEIYLRVTSDLPGAEVRAALACRAPDAAPGTPPLEILHRWTEAGVAREHREVCADPARPTEYRVPTGVGRIENEVVVFRVPSARA